MSGLFPTDEKPLEGEILQGPLKMSATAVRQLIEATDGNNTQLGAILLATMGMYPRRLPAFGLRAVITSDSHIMCDFRTKDGSMHPNAFVCSVRDLQDNFRGLADHCKLSDPDRLALFDGVKRWIATDYRPIREDLL